MAPHSDMVTSCVSARVGLLGNPSDGFDGCAISLACNNFFCTVTLEASDRVHVIANQKHDPCSFSDLQHLEHHVNLNGYYGGQRLLMATLTAFSRTCRSKGVTLPEKSCSISYETTIPRQAGLSGSSAIICAAFNCLLEWYEVEDRFPIQERPAFVLAVEQEELDLTAGLMDRVAQVYGGLMFMDLSAKHGEQGCGEYEYLPNELLPTLWMVYDNHSSCSSKTHAPVKQRWLDGDEDVVSGMKELAEIARQGKELLTRQEGHIADDLAALMDQNYSIRHRMYGVDGLGKENLEMIRTVKSAGAAGKFCGSGGCILALCPAGEDQAVKLLDACLEKGYTCEKVKPAPQVFKTVLG